MKKDAYQLLLDINSTLAAQWERGTLLKTIVDKLQPVFGFYDIGLFVLSDDGNTLTDWATQDPSISLSSGNIFLNQLPTNEYNYKKSGFEQIADQISKKGSPLIVSYQKGFFKEYATKIVGKEVLTYLIEQGYDQFLVIDLKNENGLKGFLFLNYLKNQPISNEYNTLLKAVTDQLIIAITNIKATELLREEKQKTEKLLEITKTIAQVNDHKDLFRRIYKNLKPIFGFDDVVIVVREDADTLRHLVGDAHKDVRKLRVYEENVGKPFSISKSVYENIYGNESHEVVRMSIQKMTERYPKHWGTKFAKEAGYEDWISTLLYSSGKPIGNLEFLSRKKGFFNGLNLSLFKNTANQLATAVANILANEQVLEEKQKTEDLLSVTEAIANITTGPELVRAIFDKLQKVIPFDESGLFHLDFENNKERDLIVDYGYDASVVGQEIQDADVVGWLPLSELSKVMAKKTVALSAKELYEQFDHPHFKYTKKTPFKSIIAGPLEKGKTTIGLFYFWSKKENAFDHQQSLFKSICDQLSVALSNILANENIADREQFKSLQAGILSAFETSFKPKENFGTVARLFQGTVPFDMLAFSIYDAQTKTVEGHGYRRTGKREYQYIDENNFLNIINLDQETFIKSWRTLDYKEIQFFNGKAFLKSLEKDGVKKILHKKIGIQSSLIAPIKLNQQRTLLMTFFSMKKESYTAAHSDLVEKIVPSIRLAMDRILAYRDIKGLNERLKQEKDYLEEELKTNYNLHKIVGSSDAIQQVFAKIDIVKNTDTTVLLTGETGTGKELVARALHEASTRKVKTLVKVNCATLPKELVESELFGHEKGAFTGALQQRIGKFELAHGGTIFLDEIGELPLELQSKLLRVIQEKEFERLGGNKVIKTDARIIAATNRDLENEVAEGNFRSDLYFRLSVFPIHLPPLRERQEDVEELAYHFLKKYNQKVGRKIKKISNEDLKQIKKYPWPGNVRELEHVIERSVLLSKGSTLQLALGTAPGPSKIESTVFEPQTMQEAETSLLLNTLKYCNGKIRGEGGAAELLDMPPTTLEYRIKRAGIQKKHIVKKN